MQIDICLFLIGAQLMHFAQAQLYWTQIFESLSYSKTYKPAPRRDSAIAYDRERNRIIIFGGCQTRHLEDYYPVLFDDTWEYDLSTNTWKELTYLSVRPSARYGMTYAHSRYGLYIATGKGIWNTLYNDIWVFDFSSNLWKTMEKSAFQLPAPRYYSSGGIYPNYEELNTRVLNNFYMAQGKSEDWMYENVYRYGFTDARNLNGIWRELFRSDLGPYADMTPHARYGQSSAMVASDILLMFGGCLSGKYTGGPCPSSDSWLYYASGNRWEKVDSHCIAPKHFSSMATLVPDEMNRFSAVLFGGTDRERTFFPTVFYAQSEYDNEVSVFDSMEKRWVKKRVQGFYFPQKRNGHSMCSGKFNGEFGVFMFGGFGHAM